MDQGSVEIGWLLDDGSMCLGLGPFGLFMVTYTNPNAIRFARELDAINMRTALAESLPMTMRACKPVEHAWGPPR
jgi:hypothetical protein